jgi:hypothetical protein
MSLSESMRESVLAREALRCRALVERDQQVLDELLDPALMHTHSTGETHDKAAYLSQALGPALTLAIERGALEVQLIGEIAVMRGTISTTVQPPAPIAAVTVHCQALQLWRLHHGAWRLLAYQATRTART